MSFTIFQNEKRLFQAIKRRSSKNSKKFTFFPKGLIHGFGPKMDNYRAFFFQAIEARKMSFTIFQNEKRPFQAIKRRNSKSRKIDFFSKGVNPLFRSKNGQIQSFFFLGNRGQENVLYDIVERKKAFLGYKNKKFKKSKH